jgi:hypothetical protein
MRVSIRPDMPDAAVAERSAHAWPALRRKPVLRAVQLRTDAAGASILVACHGCAEHPTQHAEGGARSR